jgi:Cu(I)/Ag(I) efflux system membrane fusion protein
MNDQTDKTPKAAPATPTSKQPASRKRRPTAAVVMLLAGMAIGRFACAPTTDAHSPGETGAATETAQASVWTCAMHPQIRLPEPGKCPICYMDLIPVPDGGNDGLDPSMLRMSDNAVALAEVVTMPVERRSVSREIRMVGRVTIDETLLSYITAWVPSRLDRMFVDYTGVSVRAGDHMVEVYSPNLIATQQELLQAVKSVKLLEDSPVDVLRDRQAESVASAKERLRLWGLQPTQIEDIIAQGKPLEHVTINSPSSGIVIHKNAAQGDYVETGTRIYTIADLSRVWVQLDAYESDLAWLHYGQHVELSSEAWPGETFGGRISFIDPVLDDRTRTVKVRLNVSNADGRLKPDMFIRATVHAPMTATGKMIDPELAGKWMCPMHPEVIEEAPGGCRICGMDLASTGELGFGVAEPGELPLVIPATAPLVTGKRAVVYVRVPDTEQPTFEGREIALGSRAGDWYIVPEGLAEGELVVVNGAFKIDSELQIRAKPSMMSPEGGIAPPGHDHGGATKAGMAHDAAPEPFTDVPLAFREQLGGLVRGYLDAQAALAADDAVSAATSGQALLVALGEVDMTQLEGGAHMAWMDSVAALSGPTRQLGETQDIEAQREALRDITGPLLRALETFGYATDGDPVAVFHCPMAFDDGADWLQTGDTTSNPYYGDAMLRCGDRVRGVPTEN